MRVLLTSGGTRVPIDRVRHIGNMSRGTFGSRIAFEMLEAGMRFSGSNLPPWEGSLVDDLVFLHARDSRRPFQVDMDLADPDVELVDVLRRAVKLDEAFEATGRDVLRQVTYRNFGEYAKLLRLSVEDKPVDLVILAAAVSDFLVRDYVDGKIRSQEQLNIILEPAEKLIASVKRWNPTCKLVGFKLMVDSTREQLIAAARESLVANGCEFVVANDLRDIQNDDHQILLVTNDSVQQFFSKHSCDENYLARVVATNSMALIDDRVIRKIGLDIPDA